MWGRLLLKLLLSARALKLFHVVLLPPKLEGTVGMRKIEGEKKNIVTARDTECHLTVWKWAVGSV